MVHLNKVYLFINLHKTIASTYNFGIYSPYGKFCTELTCELPWIHLNVFVLATNTLYSFQFWCGKNGLRMKLSGIPWLNHHFNYAFKWKVKMTKWRKMLCKDRSFHWTLTWTLELDVEMVWMSQFTWNDYNIKPLNKLHISLYLMQDLSSFITIISNLVLASWWFLYHPFTIHIRIICHLLMIIISGINFIQWNDNKAYAFIQTLFIMNSNVSGNKNKTWSKSWKENGEKNAI